MRTRARFSRRLRMRQEIMSGNPRLIEIIRQEIAAQEGRTTFARFMELALYHPDFGYYQSPHPRPGRSGDFLTAPEATARFGHTVARQIAEFWERLGNPESWSVREYGAGTGALAYDIMAGLATSTPGAFAGLTYRLVEIDPARRRDVQVAMNEAGLSDKVVVESPDEPLERVTGVVLANEIADAMPIHRLQRMDDGWHEHYVGWASGAFRWEPGDLSEPVRDYPGYFEAHGVEVAPSAILDVSPAAAEWFAGAVAHLDRGYALVIDYGYPVDVLYRDHRLAGTIRGYAGHEVTDNPFERVGEQDLTAHVDFTALREAGERQGLSHAGFTTQGAFLTSLGLGEALLELQRSPGATVEEYLAVQAVVLRLIDPGGLGRFGVMIMARDAPVDPPLQGFADPPPGF
jgi:SAM-dependent MidA family methyltransferase